MATGEHGLHQLFDLGTTQWSSQPRQCPAGLQQYGSVVVDVVDDEHAFAEAGQELIHLAAAEGSAAGAGCPFQPIQDSCLIPFGLQSAEEPGAAVCQSFVVEVDGVLSGEDDSQSEGACLFEQCEHGLFAGWIADGREVAEDFIHIQQCSEAGGAGLLSHPGDQFIEQHGDEEHAFRVGQVSDGDDGQLWFAGGRKQQAVDLQWFSLQPCGEAGRGDEVIELHGQFEAIGLGVAGFEFEEADAVEGWLLDTADECFESEGLSVLPGMFEDAAQQNEFAAADGICFQLQQCQQSCGGGLDSLSEDFGIWRVVAGGWCEGFEYCEW